MEIELSIATSGRDRPNHWFDCLVGCAVAASMQAMVRFGTDGEVAVKRDRLSFKDMQVR